MTVIISMIRPYVHINVVAVVIGSDMTYVSSVEITSLTKRLSAGCGLTDFAAVYTK